MLIICSSHILSLIGPFTQYMAYVTYMEDPLMSAMYVKLGSKYDCNLSFKKVHIWLLKRGNRNNTGNRWRNKTFLMAKFDIFSSNRDFPQELW